MCDYWSKAFGAGEFDLNGDGMENLIEHDVRYNIIDSQQEFEREVSSRFHQKDLEADTDIFNDADNIGDDFVSGGF